MDNDLDRQNRLLTDRIEWYQEDRRRLKKNIFLKFQFNLICLSGGVLIGATLMLLFSR